MKIPHYHYRFSSSFRLIAWTVLLCFSLSMLVSPGPVQAQTISSSFGLPQVGTMVNPSSAYLPAMLKGIEIQPQKPFEFNFFVDTGESGLKGQKLQDESQRLIKYFLASLTIPETNLWVNLSPYEKERVIPDELGRTEMGRDLLGQDYILKQLTASLTYPETDLGKTFWDKVKKTAFERFGTKEIPYNTFNKVWIVPADPIVYQKGLQAFVVESHLKVLLEKDYRAKKGLEPQVENLSTNDKNVDDISADIVREIILPAIEKEVNEGKNFASLRQIQNALVLAVWYKKTLKQSFLYRAYANQQKTTGIDLNDPKINQEIYDQYLQGFKQGVYSYIKEDLDATTQEMIPRKYFSGGYSTDHLEQRTHIVSSTGEMPVRAQRVLFQDLQKMSAGSSVIVKVAVDFDQVNSADIGRRSFLKTMLGVGTLMVFDPKILLAQVQDSLKTVQAYFKYFADQANPNTGFSASHFGDQNPIRNFGTQTYDMSLRAIGEAGVNGAQIIDTYSRNTAQASGENSPQTFDVTYDPAGGILNNIRVKNFDEQNWWNTWEFKITAGDNAWIGMAALHNYVKTQDDKFLRFAKERADFLLKLQDNDGGLRFGPKGQYHPSGDKSFFWNIKSTEGNESSLYLFDMLYEITQDKQYKTVADQIYEWLINEMFDADRKVFRRGARYTAGQWIKDDAHVFAPDTTSWAPMERILNDKRFGVARKERLQEFEKSIQATEKMVGIYQGNVLKGISFSPESATHNVISIEWSSQFALRYWRMVQEYSFLKEQTKGAKERAALDNKAQEFRDKYESLIAQIGTHFKQKDGAFIAPYAVFVDGTVAANVPTGHEWTTPSGYASVANVYYAFAVAKFDPQILDRTVLGVQGQNDPTDSLESRIIGAMSEGDRSLLEDITNRLNAVANRYGWDQVFGQLENNRTDKDLAQIDSVLATLRLFGVTDEQIAKIRDRIIPVNVNESLLQGENSRLGGLIVRHSNTLKILFPRSHLQGPIKSVLGDLLHEIIEVELLDAGIPVEEAHQQAMSVNAILDEYWDDSLEESMKAAKPAIEKLLNSRKASQADGVVGARYSPNLSVSTLKIQGENGSQDLRIKHPVTYLDGGQVKTLDMNTVNAAVTKAFDELQAERFNFDISLIKGAEIISETEQPYEKKADIVEIPLQTVISWTDSENVTEDGAILTEAYRDEMLKTFLYHEEGESHGISEEESDTRDLHYLADLKPAYPTIPYYSNAPPIDYRIVVPIFNEGNKLEEVLNRIKSSGYLGRITFVNDASTDNSREILERWEKAEGIEVLHLKENKKKEGAIRDVLEKLEKEGRLTEKVILLDADSFISPVESGKGLNEMIDQAAAYMDDKGVAGMAFRYDIDLPKKPSFLQKAQYAEFAGFRFINRVAANQHQLWVINGRGGIFRSDVLLPTLRDMQYDFETGDLLVTVKMMREGHKVAYYDKIKVETMDVNTIADYFKQRQRWERGTVKVFFNEGGFYVREMNRLSKIGILSIFNIGTRVGIPLGLTKGLLIDGDPTTFFTIKLPILMAAWAAISTVIAISDKGIRQEGFTARVIRWSMFNAFLYVGVTIPARAVGLYDAAKYFLFGKRQEVIKEQVVSIPDLPDNQNASSPLETQPENPGGIDLNPVNFELRIKRGSDGVPLPFENQPAEIQNFKIDGFVPVIINITPIPTLPMFLSMTEDEKKELSSVR